MTSQRCAPQPITLDGYAASHRAVREVTAGGSLPTDAKLCSSKYLNNLIEQDHRSVNSGIAVMLASSSARCDRDRWHRTHAPHPKGGSSGHCPDFWGQISRSS
jgi:transposase-like protein